MGCWVGGGEECRSFPSTPLPTLTLNRTLEVGFPCRFKYKVETIMELSIELYNLKSFAIIIDFFPHDLCRNLIQVALKSSIYSSQKELKTVALSPVISCVSCTHLRRTRSIEISQVFDHLMEKTTTSIFLTW